MWKKRNAALKAEGVEFFGSPKRVWRAPRVIVDQAVEFYRQQAKQFNISFAHVVPEHHGGLPGLTNRRKNYRPATAKQDKEVERQLRFIVMEALAVSSFIELARIAQKNQSSGVASAEARRAASKRELIIREGRKLLQGGKGVRGIAGILSRRQGMPSERTIRRYLKVVL